MGALILVALALAQVLTWLAARGQLLKMAPLATIRAAEDDLNPFPCTIISVDLANKVGKKALAQWAAAAEQAGMQVGTESYLRGTRHDFDPDQCSRLSMSVAWTTPLLGCVESFEWNPRFDSNGFRSYFVPVMGKWIHLATRQTSF